jgi:lysozyme
MTASDNCYKLISGFEGFKAAPYNDTSGNATNGYGHLIHLGPFTHSDPTVNVQQALTQLHLDVQTAVDAVNRLVTVPLNQNQFDALVSFTYNEGGGRLRGSSLLKFLNAGDYGSVPAEMDKWVYSGGHAVAGLVERRKIEAALFAKNA